MILGVSEHLGVRISLGVVRMGAEPALQFCSGCRFRQVGTHALAESGFLHPRILVDPVTLGVGADTVASPMILGILEQLGVLISLGVVGVGVEPAFEVCSGHRFRPEGTCTTG